MLVLTDEVHSRYCSDNPNGKKGALPTFTQLLHLPFTLCFDFPVQAFACKPQIRTRQSRCVVL